MFLLDEFLRKNEELEKRIYAKTRDPLVIKGSQAIAKAARRSDKIQLSAGAVQMVIEKLLNYDETIEEVQQRLGEQEEEATALQPQERGTWIWFGTPIGLPPISAMLIYSPAAYLATGKDTYQMYLIGPDADIKKVMETRTAPEPTSWYFVPELHTCKECKQGFRNHLLPCADCQRFLLLWSHLTVIISLVSNQFFAEVSSIEKTYTVKRRAEKRGDKKLKPIKYHFQVIDANQRTISLPPPEEEKARQKEQIDSWVAKAREEGTLTYEPITTRPFQKTYRSPRYSEEVRGKTVEYPHGITRKQPMLKENVGLHVKKVVASDYEHI